jgi:hypothetical protein
MLDFDDNGSAWQLQVAAIKAWARWEDYAALQSNSRAAHCQINSMPQVEEPLGRASSFYRAAGIKRFDFLSASNV